MNTSTTEGNIRSKISNGMKNKKGFVVPLVIIIVALLAIGGGVYYYINNYKIGPGTPPENFDWSKVTRPVSTSTEINLVGDDRDEHGCIGSAGYSWCAEKNQCLRTWEQKCEEIKPQVISVSLISILPDGRRLYNVVGNGFDLSTSVRLHRLSDSLKLSQEQSNSSGTAFMFILPADIVAGTYNLTVINHTQESDPISFIFSSTPTTTHPVACTMDAMMCPDGTYVGRSGPNCEFICPN